MFNAQISTKDNLQIWMFAKLLKASDKIHRHKAHKTVQFVTVNNKKNLIKPGKVKSSISRLNSQSMLENESQHIFIYSNTPNDPIQHGHFSAMHSHAKK